MSEKQRRREAFVERTSAEVKKHYEQLGRPMTADAAQNMVASMARRRDREREAGDTRNKKKGRESGRRRERAAAEAAGAAADRARTIRRIRTTTFVDFGRKG